MYSASPVYCDRCGKANRAQAQFCYGCGQPLPVVPTSAPAGGENTVSATTGQFDVNHLLKQRYRITGQLGSGGMGAVYKAEDTQFGDRLVAVKEMSQSGLDPEEVVEATEGFKQEALLLAGLMHPNLPRIYDHFTDEGQWYLVMDFIQGETLESHLSNAIAGQAGGASHTETGMPGLPLQEVLDIGIQLASVLSYLHTRQPPIIFRDLKPDNVMLTPESHIYLIDFGIARHFKPGQTKDTKAFVSWGYAAPEQYGKAQTTPRSDIYSMGATLHHLLSGNNPTHTPFRFAPLRIHTRPVVFELEKLIMQMVSIDENQRLASMTEVKQELQRISALLSTEQLSASRLEMATTPQELPKVTIPEVRSEAASHRPSLGTRLYTYQGHSERVFALDWSRDGKRIASGGYDHTVQIWEAANGREIFAYRGHSDPVRCATWAPDGKSIASAGNDHTVQVWSAATGRKIFTYRGHSDWALAATWSPDSKRIASAGLGKTVLVWEATTGRRISAYRGHASYVNDVAWSPDGTRIASGGDDGGVHVWQAL